MKLEKLNFYLPEIPSLNIADVINRFISEQQKKEEEIFTSVLRIMAEPPIKGEITKGKVRWRGIRIVQYNDGFKNTKWLEQRGKQISPKLSLLTLSEMAYVACKYETLPTQHMI